VTLELQHRWCIWCYHLRMSQTLHITVPEKVFASLERTAKSVQQPLEQVAAEWLERVATSQDDPLDALVGSFSSGGSDWAEKHDAHLGEAIKRSLE
jgi:hypothetical protein